MDDAAPTPAAEPKRAKVVLIDDQDDSDDEEVGKRIFVGNLPESTTPEAVMAWLGDDFKKKVEYVKLARDKWDKSFKGYAFVTFKTKEAAEKAVAERNRTYWKQGPDKNDRARKVNAQISPFFTKKGRCFWCGSKDHLTNACTRDVQGHAGSICYRCNQSGHLVKDCPKVAAAKKSKAEREKERAKAKKAEGRPRDDAAAASW